MKKNYSLLEFGVKKHETVLQNGLKVIFIEKPFAPIYAKMMIGAGTVLNTSDNGLAHMTEHLLMNGSSSTTKEEFYGIMEPIGGFINAFTSKEWMSVDAEIAELEHLSQLSHFFSEALGTIYVTSESLAKEKEIIFSEIQKSRSDPRYDLSNKLRKTLTRGSSWGYTNLGIAEEMKNITLAEVENFFTTYCVVENMTLLIAGGCTLADIEKYFSKIKLLHGKKSVLPTSPLPLGLKQRLFYKRDCPQTDLLVGFLGPEADSRDGYIIDFIMTFAHGGMTSSFYRQIRSEKGLAYSISNSSYEFNKTKYIGTSIGVPVDKVEQTIEAVLECYRKLIVNGISEKEIKEKIKTLWFSAKRNNEKSVNWVFKFSDCLSVDENSIIGDYPDIFNFMETITPEDVLRVLKKYIKLDEFHLCIFGKEPSNNYF